MSGEHDSATRDTNTPQDPPERLTPDSASRLLDDLTVDDFHEEKPSKETKPKEREPAEDPDADALIALDDLERAPDDDGDDGDDGDDPPLTRKVKTPDGQEVEVTFDEAVAGYLRQSDYTRKTQGAAEERKRAEAERQAFNQAREQYDAQLGKLEEVIDGALEKEPDWVDLKKNHPEQYAEVWTDWQRAKEQRKAVADERARIAGEKKAEAETAHENYVREQQVQLRERIPEFKDPEKGKELRERMYVAAEQHYGIKRDVVNSVENAAVLHVLRDATEYRRILAKRDEIRKKAKGAPVVEPGARPNTGNSRSRRRTADFDARRKRLAKSGSKDDGAAALEFLDLD
jgi:hypothetical protein